MLTSELTGEGLNWAVAKADGQSPQILPAQYGIPARVFIETPSGMVRYRPIVEWAQCGPLLDKWEVVLRHPAGRPYAAAWSASAMPLHEDITQQADTARTAICRAVVAAVLGNVVAVPEELS